MKKQHKTFWAFLLVAAIVLIFSACGSNTTNSKNQGSTFPDTSVTDAPSKETASTNKDEKIVSLSKFAQFEEGLVNKQIEFKVVQKAASMVGAKEGYAYNFNDNTSVELYLFDKESEAYKESVKDNKIHIESFGITMDVVFNDDICIYYDDGIANKADIEMIFETLK